MTASPVDENVNSRFKLTERPVLSPGKCAVCGAVDRPVIDFGMDLKFYGVIYLCTICVSEAGEYVGMVRPEAHESVKLQARQSVADYLLQRNLRIITNEQYDALLSLVGFVSADSTDWTSDFLSSLDGEGSGTEPRQLRLVLEPDAGSNPDPVADDEPFDL